MLVVCRLAGLSALEAHYAELVALTQSGRVASRAGLPQLAIAARGPDRACNPAKGP
jgi:hypothetical protein